MFVVGTLYQASSKEDLKVMKKAVLYSTHLCFPVVYISFSLYSITFINVLTVILKQTLVTRVMIKSN